MKIALITRRGFDLVFEADNVRVVEDIETREYPRDENGKIAFNMNPKKDISEAALNQFASLLEDMAYYREADFDSSSLIKILFTKLPNQTAIELAELLNKEYVS